MESLDSGFAIHLQVSLSNEERQVLLGTLGVDMMEGEGVVGDNK